MQAGSQVVGNRIPLAYVPRRPGNGLRADNDRGAMGDHEETAFSRRRVTQAYFRRVPAFLLVAVCVSGRAAGQAQDIRVPERSRFDPALAVAVASAGLGDTLPIIVEYAAPDAPAAAPGDMVPMLQRRSAQALAGLGQIELRTGGDLVVEDRLWIVPAAVARATPAAIMELAADPSVVRVYLDERLEARLEPSASYLADPTFTSQAMQTIGADVVWDQGVTGIGTTIAFFDSGVDGGNAMVSGRWRGRESSVRSAWFDPFLRSSVPQDRIGHGTQVAVAALGALAAGDTLKFPDGSVIVASSDVDVVTGPAPGAEWIAARVFESFGSAVYTRRSVLLQAFQWALDPDGDPGTRDAPDVINNSWGLFPGTAEFDPCDDILYGAIDAVEAAGIAVLFASGNTGPDPASVTPPGARADATLRTLAVGATQGVPGSLSVAAYSGRGPSPCGGGIKPEVVAPGNVPEVRADGASSARLSGFAVNGTSFAVAQVSGALALVRQVRPMAGPEEAKRILLDTADDLGPVGPDNDYGHGILNVPAAVQNANASFAGGWLQARLVQRTTDSLKVGIANRGNRPWQGGEAWIVPEGRGPITRSVTRLEPGSEAILAIGIDPNAAVRRFRVAVTDESGGLVLSRVLLSGPPNLFGGYVLEAGSLAAGGNDFGRFGRIAAFRGFEWRGVELLPAAGIGIAAGGRLSDGFYVTSLGRFDIKSSPPSAETDWGPARQETDVQASRVEFRFDDREALEPVGLEVRGSAEATDVDGVAALAITLVVRNLSGSRLADVMPAMLVDWDLEGGESVRWSDELQALVAESGGGGPLAVLASEGPVVGRASIPLGTPGAGGAYEPDSGVLWDTFEEITKLSLVRGGSVDVLPGFSTATDRAALLSVGSFDISGGASESVRFWLLAADSESAAAARLEALRDEPIEPPAPDRSFTVEPPYPNPLRTGDGVMTFPFTVPDAARQSGQTLVFEVYDVAGRRLVRKTNQLPATGDLPRVTWDGYLADGLEAASGAYLYVLSLGGERRTGRILLVH